jgi:hypothetical protein
MSDEETNRVPLWLAVSFTAALSVPFGTLLGVYSLPAWVAFISWAEYFAFGESPSQLKWIYGLFPLGALTMAVFATVNNYFVQILGVNLVVSSTIWLFIMVSAAVYLLMKIPQGMDKSLAYFNGLTMFLVLNFAGIGGGPGTGGGPLVSGNLAWLLNPWIHWLWVSIAGILGAYLGWFNILITFPEIDGDLVELATWEWTGIGVTIGMALLLWIFYHPWFSLLAGTNTQYAISIVAITIILLAFGGQAMRKSTAGSPESTPSRSEPDVEVSE